MSSTNVTLTSILIILFKEKKKIVSRKRGTGSWNRQYQRTQSLVINKSHPLACEKLRFPKSGILCPIDKPNGN